jgi:hypothetical protein
MAPARRLDSIPVMRCRSRLLDDVVERVTVDAVTG